MFPAFDRFSWHCALCLVEGEPLQEPGRGGGVGGGGAVDLLPLLPRERHPGQPLAWPPQCPF